MLVLKHKDVFRGNLNNLNVTWQSLECFLLIISITSPFFVEDLTLYGWWGFLFPLISEVASLVMPLHVKNTNTSQLSLQSHIWSYVLWIWLLSKPYTGVHYNPYRDSCVGTNWSHVDLLVSWQSFSIWTLCSFSAGLFITMHLWRHHKHTLLSCFTHTTKPCDSDLFLLELFAKMSNITSTVSSNTVFFVFFWIWSIMFDKSCINTNFSIFCACWLLGMQWPCLAKF